MFPYSFGVQAPTVAKAKSDLADHVEQLQKDHPEAFKTHGAHVKAAQDAAEAVADLLSPDDDSTDVAISVHGQLTSKKSADTTKPDEVSGAEFHAYAGRLPTDPSKHAKPKKPAKAEQKADAGDAKPKQTAPQTPGK
jgi:hypothetical protein